MDRKLKSRVIDKATNPKVVKSIAAKVVMSLAKTSRPVESEQGDGANQSSGWKENQASPRLLAGLISRASKPRKN